jgi:ADP-ribose pyrophosphatase YjhB (NUDIX family)
VPSALLAIRRNIRGEASRGKLALPGGYVDDGESWQQACAREVLEETAVVADPGRVRLLDAVSTPDCGHILLFGLLPPVLEAELPPFAESKEVSERLLLTVEDIEGGELAFPLHEQQARAYLESGASMAQETIADICVVPLGLAGNSVSREIAACKSNLTPHSFAHHDCNVPLLLLSHMFCHQVKIF